MVKLVDVYELFRRNELKLFLNFFWVLVGEYLPKILQKSHELNDYGAAAYIEAYW